MPACVTYCSVVDGIVEGTRHIAPEHFFRCFASCGRALYGTTSRSKAASWRVPRIISVESAKSSPAKGRTIDLHAGAHLALDYFGRQKVCEGAFGRPARLIMERLRNGVIIVAVAAAVALMAGCEKGPVQKTGERVDRALDQDRVLGKGPVEKAGKKIDKAVDDVKR